MIPIYSTTVLYDICMQVCVCVCVHASVYVCVHASVYVYVCVCVSGIGRAFLAFRACQSSEFCERNLSLSTKKMMYCSILLREWLYGAE